MLREVKFLLRSSKQNFFLSIYLSFRVFFFKKLYRNKIHKNKFQADYQKLIKKELKLDQDYFLHNVNSLDFFFKNNNYYDKKINALEIGSYEGNSSFFFLNYFKNLNLTCVDTFVGSIEHDSLDFEKVYNNFKFNTDKYKHRLKVIKDKSDNFFDKLNNTTYDLIYIDGSHFHEDVFNDAKNSFKVLNKNGYLIFDDFLWIFYSNINENPMGGIKRFIKENFNKIKIRSINYQIILQKI